MTASESRTEELIDIPTSRAPDLENERVVSNIPTHIYQGLIGTQTRASWGTSAAQGLADGQRIYVKNSGHAVKAKTDCAQ